MFTQFKFSNFLSFKDEATLSLHATSLDDGHEDAIFEKTNEKYLKTIAIYGPNASGKTTVLKALEVFINWVLNSYKLNLSQLNGSTPFALNPEKKTLPSSFEMEFIINDKLYTYGFSSFPNKINKEWLKSGNKIMFLREGQQFLELNKKYTNLSQKMIFPSENVLFLTLIISGTGEDAITNEIKNSIQKIKIGQARNENMGESLKLFQKPEYNALMKELIYESDFGIRDMVVSEKEMSVQEVLNIMPPEIINQIFQGKQSIPVQQAHLMFDSYNNANEYIGLAPIDIGSQSEGTQQMISLSGPIAQALVHGNTLVIDELDSSLHPLMCRVLLKIFQDPVRNPKKARLIFTTHDISLLDREFLRRDQVRFTEKDKYGASILFSLADIENRKEVSFSKRYLEGRYGAIPYLKSLEEIEYYE